MFKFVTFVVVVVKGHAFYLHLFLPNVCKTKKTIKTSGLAMTIFTNQQRVKFCNL